MSNKAQLSVQRKNTIINTISKKEDKQCIVATQEVIAIIEKEYGINTIWNKRLDVGEMISHVKEKYPDITFATPNAASFISPDGGVLFLAGKNGKKYPILMTEVKNQGTNDVIVQSGNRPQAKGNAIERLGKNVITLKTYMLGEGIFPFICFGDGCDFAEGSSILDRVMCIAQFGTLNEDHTINEGKHGEFARGSYYFRHAKWTADEMRDIMLEVARKSLKYYFDKYGEDCFR